MKRIIINKNGLLKVNLNNLSANYKILKTYTKNSRIAGVLKSDSYGLGLERVAKKLVDLGCKDFFLTSLDESILVRSESPQSNIILLNGIINLSQNEISKVFNYNIIPTINSFDELLKLYEFAKKSNEKPKVTLHFDTGINRLGIIDKEQNKIISFCREKKISVFCVMSHLASADEPKSILNKNQKTKFEDILINFPNSIHSLANSHAIVNLKKINYNLVRIGGCLFGTIDNKKFKTVAELYAKVLQIKELANNQNNFGYNATYQSKIIKRIAILGLGYADGYPRLLSNKSYVFFKKKLPIIGSISMDYMTIDISSLNEIDIKVGDYIELIGKNISINELAIKSKTIPYEILNNIGNRVKKIYIDTR